MRLIDADKLENDIVENITVKAVSRMLAITQGQPTVEAIPIEWIKKWRRDKWLGGEPIEKRMIMAMGVRLMLEDWETENENISSM